MSPLRELQSELRRFIAGESTQGLLKLVCSDGIEAFDRLSIFRNNSVVTHTAALSTTFPVVRRLVDPRFFAYAANEFIRQGFPRDPCLSEFGCAFPAFLADFPAAASLCYLADVARLEWVISRVLLAASLPSIPVIMLVAVEGDPASIRLAIDPAVRFVASQYPVDLIWKVNRPNAVSEAVTLETGDVYLEVRAAGQELIRRHPASTWVFRSSIAAGETLGDAAEAAMQRDAAFELHAAIAAVFAEGLVVGLQ